VSKSEELTLTQQQVLAQFKIDLWWFRAGVGHLWPTWTFDVARIIMFNTQFRVQNHV